MIDTIRAVFGPCDWKSDFFRPGLWKWVDMDRTEVEGEDLLLDSSRRSVQEYRGFRVGGSREAATWAEVSLPRLIWNENGMVIHDQEILNEAWAEFLGLLGQVCDYRKEELSLSRVDLVWQFKGDCGEWAFLFSGVRHARVRRPQVRYSRGLVWPGDEVHIRMYDKRLERDKMAGDHLRLEFQLRGDRVPALMCGDQLDFALAYQTYRQLCLGFSGVASVADIGNQAEFLAWLDQSEVAVEGRRPLEVYLGTVSERHARRIRKAVAQANLRKRSVALEDLLPVSGCPEPYNLLPAELLESLADGTA